jgi:hypothetical protein
VVNIGQYVGASIPPPQNRYEALQRITASDSLFGLQYSLPSHCQVIQGDVGPTCKEDDGLVYEGTDVASGGALYSQ